MKIGLLDSGLAGLVIARYLVQNLIGYQFVYCGDTAHSPYESKSPELVQHLALRGVEALIKETVDALVITCPTIASIAAESIRQMIDIPVLDVISTNIDQPLQQSKKGCIGILSTQTAVDTNIYERQMHMQEPSTKVYYATCPLLPHLIENGWARKPETRMILKKCLQPLKVRQIDTLVIGSGHSIYMRKLIQTKIGKRVTLADPLKPLTQSILKLNESRFESKPAKPLSTPIRVLVSDLTDQFQSLCALYFRRRVPPESIIL